MAWKTSSQAWRIGIYKPFLINYVFRKRLGEPDAIGHLTVDGVQADVNNQPQADQPGLAVDTKQYIQQQRQETMQGMKSHAAALRVIDGISQEVVQVDQQRCNHYQVGN